MRSASASASQQAAYPSRGVATSIARKRATTSGCVSRKEGRNQRPSTAFGDRFHAVRAHGRGAIDPALPGRERGRRAAERKAVDPLRSVDGEPHAFEAAEREAAERDPLEPELVEELEEVSAEVVDRGRPRLQRASARARAGRSARPGSARRAARSAAPTSRASCRGSSRGRAPARRRDRRRRGGASLVSVRRRSERVPGRPAAPAEPRYVVGVERRVGSPRPSGPCRAPASSSPSDRPLASARSDASRTSARAAVRPSRSVRRSAIAFRDHLSAGEVEVGPHPGHVDLEPLERSRQRSGCAPGVGERARERLPLGLPGPGGALVLLDEGAREHGRVAASELGAGAGRHRADRRCACAASWTSLLRRLLRAPLRPRSGRAAATSSPIFASTPEAISSAAPSSAIRTRFVCQGSVGLGEAELCGVEARRSPGRAHRAPQACRQRRRAALRGPSRRSSDEPRAGVEHGDEPACRLEPERRRHGLLQQRATGHRRVPVRARQRRARAR